MCLGCASDCRLWAKVSGQHWVNMLSFLALIARQPFALLGLHNIDRPKIHKNTGINTKCILECVKVSAFIGTVWFDLTKLPRNLWTIMILVHAAERSLGWLTLRLDKQRCVSNHVWCYRVSCQALWRKIWRRYQVFDLGALLGKLPGRIGPGMQSLGSEEGLISTHEMLQGCCSYQSWDCHLASNA